MNATAGIARRSTATRVGVALGLAAAALAVTPADAAETCTRTATTVECRDGDYWTKLDLAAGTLEAIKEAGKRQQVDSHLRVLGRDVFTLRGKTPPGRYVRYLVTWTTATTAPAATTSDCPERGTRLRLLGTSVNGAVTVQRWDSKKTEPDDTRDVAADRQFGEIVDLKLCGAEV